MTVTIRPALPEDSKQIAAIAKEMNDLHAERLPGVFQPGSSEQVKGKAAEGDQKGMRFVAEVEMAVAGVIWLIPSYSPKKPFLVPRYYALVGMLAVGKKYQQQGIGRQLMRWAEDWAREQGMAEIELSVYAFNASAVAFYDSLGYEPLSTTMIKQL